MATMHNPLEKHHPHNFEGWFRETVEEMYSILVSNIERDWAKIEENPIGKRIFLDKFNRMLLELPHSARNSEFLHRIQTKIIEKAALTEDELKEVYCFSLVNTRTLCSITAFSQKTSRKTISKSTTTMHIKKRVPLTFQKLISSIRLRLSPLI
jgi:hypothetical protein